MFGRNEVGTLDNVLELGEQRGRHNQIERALCEESGDARGSAVWRDQPRDEDPGIDDGTDHLRRGVTLCAHRMKLGVGELHRVLLRQIGVPRPDTLEQADQGALAQCLVDQLGHGSSASCRRDPDLAENVLIHVHGRLDLGHRLGLYQHAVMKERG